MAFNMIRPPVPGWFELTNLAAGGAKSCTGDACSAGKEYLGLYVILEKQFRTLHRSGCRHRDNMKLITINPDSNQSLRTNLETLSDGRVVIKNTMITLPILFETISRLGVKRGAVELGIEENRVKLVLRGLSVAFELLSPAVDFDESRINAVAHAWSHSIGLAFKPTDPKGRSTAIQFLSMLEAAGVLDNGASDAAQAASWSANKLSSGSASSDVNRG